MKLLVFYVHPILTTFGYIVACKHPFLQCQAMQIHYVVASHSHTYLSLLQLFIITIKYSIMIYPCIGCAKTFESWSKSAQWIFILLTDILMFRWFYRFTRKKDIRFINLKVHTMPCKLPITIIKYIDTHHCKFVLSLHHPHNVSKGTWTTIS